MKRKYGLYFFAVISLVTVSAAAAFKWGYAVGARETLRVSARSDVLQNLYIARHLHENAEGDALSSVDARINLSVMEIAQLSNSGSRDETIEDSKVLTVVAKFRQKYPDTAGKAGISPSSDRIRDILAKYTK